MTRSPVKAVLSNTYRWVGAECQAAAAYLGLPALLPDVLVDNRRRQIAEYLLLELFLSWSVRILLSFLRFFFG
jgi:hypothetical protein